jgi:hypothetical protein
MDGGTYHIMIYDMEKGDKVLAFVAIANNNSVRKVFLQKGRFLKKGVWVGR